MTLLYLALWALASQDRDLDWLERLPVFDARLARMAYSGIGATDLKDAALRWSA